MLTAEMPPEQAMALAHSHASLRLKMAAWFALDRRLGQLVAKSSEPMLGQMRLAWWREALGRPVVERPSGDATLDAVSMHWDGAEEALLMLVEAWEELLVADRLSNEIADRFCKGRAEPIRHVAERYGADVGARVHAAAVRWAAGDAAAHVSDGSERQVLIAVGTAQSTRAGRIPQDLRGLAVLEALALRSMKLGGRPLMEGRGAALVALRVGLLGR
ncbi:hypothetical protein [Altererythrobacter sp. Z27]|uniref:hypothetical protein n=1 Tax=Altererythrobacter sp. Z27 TaxID=3461147 RepID=UPI004044EE11